MIEHFTALAVAADHWLSSASNHWSASASDFFLFERWEWKWIDKNIWDEELWKPIIKYIRLALTMLGAIFLIYEIRARRLREKIPMRWKKRVAYVMTGIAFLAYFDFFNPNARYIQYYHRHEFYHYYLGSKFSKEVGYVRLYECTMIAEIELGR